MTEFNFGDIVCLKRHPASIGKVITGKPNGRGHILVKWMRSNSGATLPGSGIMLFEGPSDLVISPVAMMSDELLDEVRRLGNDECACSSAPTSCDDCTWYAAIVAELHRRGEALYISTDGFFE